MKDLLALTADKNTEFLLKGLLPRIPAIERLREFTFDTTVHPQRDAGVFNGADEFLRPFLNTYRFVAVLLDLAGSGQENEKSREQVEAELEERITRNGWENRAAVIAIDPEIENWVWVGPTHLQAVLDWDKQAGIYEWIRERGFSREGVSKPSPPKEAFEAALREMKIPRSSALYKRLAERASYRDCEDPSFWKLIGKLREWFAI